MTDNISQLLNAWINSKSLQTVVLQETHSPANDCSDDYVVEYEARFKTSGLTQAEVEVVLTSSGYIGVGFETRGRVAQRLNVRNARQGHAAGFEPCERDERQLLPFLELVCAGKVAICARCLPLIGLGRTEAIVDAQNLPPGFALGSNHWLKAVGALKSPGRLRVLSFEPWS